MIWSNPDHHSHMITVNWVGSMREMHPFPVLFFAYMRAKFHRHSQPIDEVKIEVQFWNQIQWQMNNKHARKTILPNKIPHFHLGNWWMTLGSLPCSAVIAAFLRIIAAYFFPFIFISTGMGILVLISGANAICLIIRTHSGNCIMNHSMVIFHLQN